MKIAEKIIIQALKQGVKNPHDFDNAKRFILRQNANNGEIPRKSDLLKAYHILVKTGKIKTDLELEKLLTKRAVRTLSGVAVVTVLTKPWPCPGNCIYCPDEAKMPKSYLADEPAAARALTLKFDPYEQVKYRLRTLKDNGHPTDKVELIVKGGSWNAYPINYQYWFILRCFEASNMLNKTASPKNEKIKTNWKNYQKIEKMSPAEIIKQLLKEQKINEKSARRIIGLTLETRPDLINKNTIEAMRLQGCTRIEMGVQSTNDKILEKIKRGHNTKSVKDATRLLKNYGFKVDYHLMPQLPNSNPKNDLEMMLEVFKNPDYRPDMIKVYPCTVIKGTELYNWLEKGEYKSYSDTQLIEMLIKFKTRIPRYCRVSRLIRDIPGNHVEAGNKTTNLRQVIQMEMKKRGLKCKCLRCREAGHQSNLNKEKTKLFIDTYKASKGTEYFLSFEDKKRQIVFAFCRLRITKEKNALSEAPYFGYIRELHTYGQLAQISKSGEVQHTGLGKQLLAKAEEICKKNKIKNLAIISGVGVRGYYRKLGYKLVNGYMVKNLK